MDLVEAQFMFNDIRRFMPRSMSEDLVPAKILDTKAKVKREFARLQSIVLEKMQMTPHAQYIRGVAERVCTACTKLGLLRYDLYDHLRPRGVGDARVTPISVAFLNICQMNECSLWVALQIYFCVQYEMDANSLAWQAVHIMGWMRRECSVNVRRAMIEPADALIQLLGPNDQSRDELVQLANEARALEDDPLDMQLADMDLSE